MANGGWEFTRSQVPGSDTAEEFSARGLIVLYIWWVKQGAGKSHHIPIGEDLRWLEIRKVPDTRFTRFTRFCGGGLCSGELSKEL